MSWIERVMGATRGHVLALLRRAPRSINAMAGAMGISDNAVRAHVAAMQRDGMVETAGVARDTGGKPAQLYQITVAAEEMFPKAYAFALGEVLAELEERTGPESVDRLMREVGARAGAGLREADPRAEARVAAAAEALRSLGGDVEVSRAGPTWLIRGFGCPLSAVVREHATACVLAESLVAEISGGKVAECCDRGDRPRCCFRIDFDEPAPSEAAA